MMVSLLAINSLRGACRRVPARGTVLGVRLLATNASGEARLASSLRGLSPTSSIASTTQLLGRTRALGPCCRCSCLAVTPPAVERTLQKRAYNTDREPEAKPVAGQQQSGADDSRQEMRDANGIVGVFNRSIYSAPVETFFSIMGMEIVTIYGIHLVLKASGVVVPSDLAIAFVLSRPLRRVRLPLELAAAEVLARAFPALTRVHVMALFRAIPGYKDPEELKMDAERNNSRLQKGVAKLTMAIDKYGAAYTLGSRVTGVCIIFALYTGLRNGVDVSALLKSYGFTGVDSVGTVLGSWAAAVLMSSVLFPWNAYVGARLGPKIKSLRQAVGGSASKSS